MTNRSGSFPIEARTRSPAKELGPRALRTRALIVDTARDLFLRKGYGGVRIDDIVESAGISRGSFYTYFPSKKDVLLAVGAESYQRSREVVDEFAQIPPAWTLDDVIRWVKRYLDFLDDYGAFLVVWTQASWDDEELRATGLRTHLSVARRLGNAIQALRGDTSDPSIDPRLEGMAVLAQHEKVWHFWRVAHAPFSRQEVVDGLAGVLAAQLRRR